MNDSHRKKTVVVTGDITIDWNIARVRLAATPSYVWSTDNLAHAFCQRGGAALLADLMEAIANVLNKSERTSFEVRKMFAFDSQVKPSDESLNHSYALWMPYRVDRERAGNSGMVWRVSELLGIRKARVNIGMNNLADDTDEPALIVLDDANLGFRDHPECWPKGLSSQTARPWVLLKMSQTLATGKLWEHLQKTHPERVVVLVTANDLRHHTGVQISRQVSWERTAQDLVWELMYNPKINELAMFAHTIISFDTSGALLLSREKGNKLKTTLFFEPTSIEGEWGSTYPGYMVGNTSCLAIGIARELVGSTLKPDLHRGIQAGISAMRLLHTEGYGDADADLENHPVAFPIADVAAKIVEGESCLATVPVENPAEELSVRADSSLPEETTRLWTILETQNLGSLENTARQIVRDGLEQALSRVPIGRYGDMVTVDRREIESLNCIGGLLREYCQQSQRTPLSIAVFGPPGAGKSFAIKQVANSVKPDEMVTLTFNLSQLAGPEHLIDSFHQVRDKVLSGKVPLVFWDEFDTTLDGRLLGWLRYFLAPMQDGEFREGQIVHPIGKSVFVFAGGTSRSMEEFTAKLSDEEYRGSKLPDFISRLRGFLNIFGPNCQGNNSTDDPYYIIRRAILLRSILERNAPQLVHEVGGNKTIDIDEGVLRAFLLTKEYKHGARSLEGIVLTSQLMGKNSFERSSLPTEAQLNLYVNGREFYSLVHILEPDDELLEKLAEIAHEVFCNHLQGKGYRYGPETLENDKIHSSLRPYSELSENEKEQNRNNVRDIPNKLLSIGYAMIPARSKEKPSALGEEEVERLVRMEHERWMQEKLDTGWKYAKETAKPKKRHKLLVPWEDLPPEEKEKDYVLVKGIPQILAKAGYTIVRLG
jgi:hypothetical protein